MKGIFRLISTSVVYYGEDGKNYEELLTNLAKEEFVLTPTADSRRIAERTREFIAAYARSSTRVASVKEEISK